MGEIFDCRIQKLSGVCEFHPRLFQLHSPHIKTFCRSLLFVSGFRKFFLRPAQGTFGVGKPELRFAQSGFRRFQLVRHCRQMFFRLSQRGFSGCGFLSGLPEFLYLCLKFFLCSGEFCRNVFKVGCRIFQRIRFVRERFFLFLKRDAGIQEFF